MVGVQQEIKIAKVLVVVESLVIVVGVIFVTDFPIKIARMIVGSENAATPAMVGSEYYYNFNVDGELEESATADKSPSPYWWVNSGAYLLVKNGIGKTVQGELNKFSIWRILYDKSNPTDTDNGFHPQNIFRLFTRSKWKDFRSEAYFKINDYHLSQSPNRNASNGIFLINRFEDRDNLYYFGIRVDGEAIIKKKVGGVYHSLAFLKIFEGDYNYDSNPNLLPLGNWLGIRSEIINNNDGTVNLTLFLDLDNSGSWVKVLEINDDGRSFGGKAFLESGYAGIRTDFMDVEFRDYRNTEI